MKLFRAEVGILIDPAWFHVAFADEALFSIVFPWVILMTHDPRIEHYLELARQAGVDLSHLDLSQRPDGLSDEQLEAVVAGKDVGTALQYAGSGISGIGYGLRRGWW